MAESHTPGAGARAPEEHTYLTHQQILTVLFGVMAGMFLAALDQSIVGVALPRIVSDLGGLEHLSWVVTAYLLTSTATTPLWGKFSDLYGRRVVFQIAIVTFVIGSALCGASQDLYQLILFRAIQGAGGGGLFAIAFAIIGDIIPARDRGRYQGYFGAVFGVSSLAGPLLGGFFTDGPGWRWIFYINVPIGIAALVITSSALRLPSVRREHAIDYAGAATIVGAVTSLLLYLNWAGDRYGWTSGEALGLALLGVVLGVTFVAIELRAREPIIPMSLFRNGIFRIGTIFSFLLGFAMFGGFIYLPLYLQTAKGLSSTESGLATFPVVLGLLMFSIYTGQRVSQTGRYRIYPIVGTVLTVIGLVQLSRLQVDTPYWQIAVGAFTFGAGLGCCMQTITVAVQNAVEFRDMGVATSSVTFLRSLGAAIGTAFLGAILGTRLAHYLGGVEIDAAGGEAATSNIEAIRGLPDQTRAFVLEAYSNAIDDIYLASIPVAVLAFVVALFLKEIPLRTGGPPPAGPQAAVKPAERADSGAERERQAPVFSGH